MLVSPIFSEIDRTHVIRIEHFIDRSKHIGVLINGCTLFRPSSFCRGNDRLTVFPGCCLSRNTHSFYQLLDTVIFIPVSYLVFSILFPDKPFSLKISFSLLPVCSPFKPYLSGSPAPCCSILNEGSLILSSLGNRSNG